MPVNYIDPWEGRVPSLKGSTNQQPSQNAEKNKGIFGDLIDVAQQGLTQSFAGDAEAIGQVSGSDTFKNIGKALAQSANSQSATMTDEAKQALSQHIFKDDPDSFTGVAFDDGATNWRTWALQFGGLAGQVVGTVATGFGAGSVVKFGAKQAIKAVAKEAITKEAQQLVAKNAVKEAIRNGALDDVRAALIAAPDKAAMNAVLNKATSRLGGIATTAVAGSMAAGMRAKQARDEYLGLDADTLNQNPEFQKAYWEIADNPENQGLDTATIHNAAKEMLAEKAATTAFFDKKALLSDFASGAYVPGAGGVIGRGAATASKMGRFGLGLAQEWPTEAWQGGETQRAVNEAIKEWGDESRDPMANVVRTRWEEGTLGGVFGGMAKVVEGQHVAPSKPIVTVENSPSTGNSTLDSALAQSNADEQSRYDALTGHVDDLSKPSYMRNGEISPALENAIAQFRLDALQQQQAQQRKDGIMQPFDSPVTGNPDEPAFLRSRAFNPTGRDLSQSPDADVTSPVQQALAQSNAPDPVDLLNQAKAAGNVGPTPMDEFSGEVIPAQNTSRELAVRPRNESVTVDGQANEIQPESRGLPYNQVINMGGTPGDGVNNNYVPPVTADRVTADQSLGQETIIDPRSPVGQAIESAGNGPAAIFDQLKSLRVTKRGKPFSSEKEAQLASRATETPIELPTGGYGVVDKAELEQVQASQAPVKQPSSNAGQLGQSAAPTATVMNGGTKSDNVIDQSSLNERGDNRESPWLFADGKVVSSNGDHISLSDEYGYSGYRDMSKGTGAIRSTFYKPRNSTDEQTPFVSLQLFDDQKLTPEQFKSVESFVKANDAKITLGVDRSGNNTDNVEKNEVSLDELKDKYTADQAVVAKESQPQPAMTQEEKEDSDIDNPQIIEHTTGKNKVIRGVVRKDLTVDEAKAIDPYTFKKDGSYFIREKHLDKLPAKPVENKAEPTTAESVPEPKASDGGMTVDQLKQLRTETINKINQQEADNRAVDDRLLSKKDKLDKAIAEAEQSGHGMKPGEAHLAAKEWLRQFKTDIGVKVARNQAEFNQMMKDLGQSTVSAGEVANAAYIASSKTLILNASAIQNQGRLRQIMRHEILGHHGLEHVIGKGAMDGIWKVMLNGYQTSKAIKEAIDTVAQNYKGDDADTIIHEAFAHYAENRPVDQGALGRLWDRVVSMVKAAMVKAGFIKQNEAEKQLDSILKTIAENMRNGREAESAVTNTNDKVLFSKSVDSSSFGRVGGLLKEGSSSLINKIKEGRSYALGTLTDLQIDQIYKEITGGAVSRYQKLRAKMEADRNDILLDAETNIDPLWDAMPKAEKAALSNLMHDATMSKLHPDMALEDNTLYQEVKEKLARARTPDTKAAYQAELDTIKENHKTLSERYRLSSKQSKELYQKMRDVYTKQWADLRDAIEQRIEDQMGEGGKALASEMRLKMEQALKHGPYFPLARFGKYVIRGKKGDQYFREHFEKRKDAEAALKQYRSEGFNATLSVKEEGSGDQANAHALGMEIMEALDKAQKEGTNPADLKDTVWQAMLEMLPDASFAKHAIHRKRVKGASRDGHRAYLQSVYHYAHHVSKIRYGHKMKAELDAMKDQVKLAERGEESSIKPDDIEVAQQVLNEMNKRHELNMNPKGSSLAGMAGNIGFLFYLGASPASAVINLTQNVMVMLPQLAGKYGLMKASKFMMKAMSDYIRHGVFKSGTKEAWVSLTRATKGVSADEKEMLNTLYRAGVLDLTQAHSIAARADTDQQNVKQSAAWARTGMLWAGSLFHNAEVLNREVAALTAYRLLKEQNPSISMESAADQVTEMVYDGHGNYAASNRPRYMRSDVMKVLTQFKIYSQMMTYTLARNAVLAAKGDKTALKTLGVMFGTTWMMAGMMGMPTPVGLILYGLASLFDDDDDRTGEASFRLGLTEVFGAEVGELIAKGPVDAISGLNISGRTGLSDLWWRSPKEGTEGDDLTFHYVQQIAGPVLGIGVSAVRGMREFANGDIQRGVEAMSPKAVKDLAKAYRQATEGEQTRNGDSVIDDVGAWNVAMQAMGFSSAQMAKVYSAREYIKGKEKIIEDRRSNLLADYFTATREQDTDAMQDVMNNIREFNASHNKAEAITGKTLKQSMKSRERSGERTQAGTYLSSKREYLRSEGAFLKQE